MTNVQAIDLLDNLVGMIEDNHESDYDTALKLAFKALESVGNTDTLADGDRAVSLNAVITEIGRWLGYLDEDMITRIQTGIKRLPSVSRAKIDYGYIKKIAEFFREWDGNENATLEFSVSELRNIIHDHTLKCNLQNKVDELPSMQPEREPAHWIRWYEEIDDGYSKSYEPHCKCSNCQKENDPQKSHFMKYCSNCGERIVEAKR